MTTDRRPPRDRPVRPVAARPSVRPSARPSTSTTTARPTRTTSTTRSTTTTRSSGRPPVRPATGSAPRPPARAPRPATGPGERSSQRALERANRTRQQRDGETTEAERRAAQRRRRLLIGVLATLLVLAGAGFFMAAPLRSLRHQQSAAAEADAKLAAIQAEQRQVDQQRKLLETDAEVKRRARLYFGFVMPGEVAYNVVPAPADPLGLPATWPFTGVERELGAG